MSNTKKIVASTLLVVVLAAGATVAVAITDSKPSAVSKDQQVMTTEQPSEPTPSATPTQPGSDTSSAPLVDAPAPPSDTSAPVPQDDNAPASDPAPATAPGQTSQSSTFILNGDPSEQP